MKHKVESVARGIARFSDTPNRMYLFHTTEVVPDGAKVTVEWETPDVHKCPEMSRWCHPLRIELVRGRWLFGDSDDPEERYGVTYCPYCGKKL
jgi:hypothetical protein